MKDFFKTKYRIVEEIDRYAVQEHEWWDLIYGHWWYVGTATSLEGAKEIIRLEKEKRRKPIVVYEE